MRSRYSLRNKLPTWEAARPRAWECLLKSPSVPGPASYTRRSTVNPWPAGGPASSTRVLPDATRAVRPDHQRHHHAGPVSLATARGAQSPTRWARSSGRLNGTRRQSRITGCRHDAVAEQGDGFAWVGTRTDLL